VAKRCTLFGMPNGNDYRALEREFVAAGIDVTAPGFCDSQQFIRAEERDRDLLLKYGRYVRGRPREAAYVERVRSRVPRVVEYLAAELGRDGRLGACIDASSVALKFLEREGIWGFGAVGSLVADFVNPPGRRVVLHHFMHPSNPARAGHAWLCVQPFEIVDMTLQAQTGFSNDERRRLAPVVAEVVRIEANVAVDDVAEPELRELFLRERGRAARLEDFVGVALRDYWQQSPPRVVTTGNVRLKYIECGIIAGDGAPLEQMRNLVLSGRTPAQLHAEFMQRFPRR
jgi:hypothetical protein